MYSLVAGLAASGLLVSASEAVPPPRRLRIVNGCLDGPMWIAHTAAGGTGPDPQDVKLEPLDHHDFQTPDNLVATRFWPKMGCDSQGSNCTVGDSGGPGEGCVKREPGMPDDYSMCAPPVDTKFEASFGENGQPCNPSAPGGSEMRGCDYVDISLVDGFTLPVKLDIHGDCKASSAQEQSVSEIDCTGLSMDACPNQEQLTDDRVVDLAARDPITKQVGGCYSPCLRLLDTKWAEQAATTAEDPLVSPYCCPTPPVSPSECRAGPIMSTQFLQVVKEKCPGAYSFAYDDGDGLLRCSTATTYVLTYYCLHSSAGSSGLSPRGFLQAP